MALIECKECKNQVSDTAKVCPSCGKKMPKKLSVIHWIGIVLLGMITLAVLSGNKNSHQAATSASGSSKPVEHATDVKIHQILSDYKNNEVNADNKYKGKLIRVTGLVDDIKKDFTDSLYVTIGTGAEFEIPVIQAFFDDTKNNQLAQLQKGQNITVTCRVDGLMMNVLAKDCSLQ